MIDKLLQKAVNKGATDIHLVVGQPPVFRLQGRMRRIAKKILHAEDTFGLMKSITPDRCQLELQENGNTDFEFAFGHLARFRASVFKSEGKISMVLRQISTDGDGSEPLGSLVPRPRQPNSDNGHAKPPQD